MKENERVVALSHTDIDAKKIYLFGYGDFLGNKTPDNFLGQAGVANPCIKLDNGQLVWGMQCWWTSVEQFEKELKEGGQWHGYDIVEEPLVPEDEIAELVSE